MDTLNRFRRHLVKLLQSKSAHAGFDAVTVDFPEELRGKKPDNAPHTPWQLIEHMRIAQWDILEFSRNPEHVSPEWPTGYWPSGEAPPSPSAWDESLRAFQSDLTAMQKLIMNEGTDLLADIPHGTGQTILREALLVADHNSHHLGQLILLRRLLGGWPEK